MTTEDRNHLWWDNGEMFPPELTINRLDRELGYPALTAVHKPLLDFADEVRHKAIAEKKPIDRDEQVKRLADFFGMEEPVVPISAPGHALVSLLAFFTSPSEEILIPEPAYLFEGFVNCIPHSQRVARRVAVDELEYLISQTGDKTSPQSAIVETPYIPVSFSHQDKVYQLLADGTFSIVIYDRVNDIYGDDTTVQTAMEGNRLSRRPFPTSEKAAIVEGTSKLFPEEFRNFALVSLSDSLYAQKGKEYEEYIHRTGFRTPSAIDLYVMAEVLYSEHFPQFLADVKRLTGENFEYLKEVLKGIPVIYDGNYAWIQPTVIGSNIKARNSHEYFVRTKEAMPFLIRIPIAVDREELEQTFRKQMVRTVVFSKS